MTRDRPDGGSADPGEKVRDHVRFVEDAAVGSDSGRDRGSDGGGQEGGGAASTAGEAPGEHEEGTGRAPGGAATHPEATAAPGDHGLDTDERVERAGTVAGVLVVPASLVALSVGPWPAFGVSPTAGLAPVAVREAASALVVFAPLAVVVLVGLATGAAYRATTADAPDDYRAAIAVRLVLVEVVLVAAGYLLAVLAVGGDAALRGDPLAGALVVVAGVAGLPFVGAFALVAVAIAVGVPAHAGVVVGDLLAVAAGAADS